MSHNYKDSVKQLIQDQLLVSFEFEPQNDLELWGFILDCNEEFTLVNVFDRDSYDLDGFALFFNQDVSEYWVYESDENYLETKYIDMVGIAPVPKPNIDIGNIGKALESIGAAFELINVYRDDMEGGSGTIVGSLSAIGKESFGLIPMRTDGVWKSVPGFFRLEDVSRIDFGTKYLEVLLKVASCDEDLSF